MVDQTAALKAVMMADCLVATKAAMMAESTAVH